MIDNENLKHEIEHVIKSSESIAEKKSISMEKIFINTENSKGNEVKKFVFNLSQRLDLGTLAIIVKL